MVLSLGYFLPRLIIVLGLFCPVFPEPSLYVRVRIIWGIITRYQGVSFDVEPREFWDMRPCLVVSKYPIIFPIMIEASEIALVSPFVTFVWVSLFGVFLSTVEHPFVEFVKDLAGYPLSVVICPSSDNGSQLCNDCPNFLAPVREPDLSEFIADVFDGFGTWFD